MIDLRWPGQTFIDTGAMSISNGRVQSFSPSFKKAKIATIIGVMKPRITCISSKYGHNHPKFVIFGDISGHFFLKILQNTWVLFVEFVMFPFLEGIRRHTLSWSLQNE